MKKICYLLVFLAALAAANSGKAIIGDSGRTAVTEMVMITPSAGTMTIMSWFSGDNFRTETYKGEGKNKQLMSINITKGGFMYMLNPQQKTAMKMSMNSPMAKSSKQENNARSWEDVMSDMKKRGYTVENRGKQKWEGTDYTVWRVTDTKNKNYTEYYVDGKGMTKRFVTYDSKGKMISDTRIIKAEQGVAIPASTFEVPAGYQIQEMPNMPMMK